MASVLLALWTGTASAASASVVHTGPSDRKQIALTFDDNTKIERGVATLRALQKNQVPATLFVIGSAIKGTRHQQRDSQRHEAGAVRSRRPYLVAPGPDESVDLGHGLSDRRRDRRFPRRTGARTVPLFRPPYGSTNSRVAAVAGSEGFRHLVLWDIDPRDWAGGSAATIADHVIGHAHSGAIVVMHLSAPHTAAAIPSIVSELRGKGYEFVTVSTMLRGDRLFLDVDRSAGTVRLSPAW